MSESQVKLHFVLRGLFWGVSFGIVGGFLFGSIFLNPRDGGSFYAALGTVTGIVLGLANGVVLAQVSLRFPNILNNIEIYWRALRKACLRTTLVITFVVYFGALTFMFRNVFFSIVFAFLIALLAAIGGFLACEITGRWYVYIVADQRKQKQTP